MSRTQGGVACADEAMVCAGRAVQEVPLLQPSLLVLDSGHALAAQDEEVLLPGVGVVQAARLARVEYREPDAELRKALRLEVGSLPQRGHVGFEQAPCAERLVRDPGGVSDVHHEPARRHRRKPRPDVLEPRLRYLACHAVECMSECRHVRSSFRATS
jgi:hypothetical protein